MSARENKEGDKEMSETKPPEIAVLFSEFNPDRTSDKSDWYELEFITINDKEDVRNPPFDSFANDLKMRNLVCWRDGKFEQQYGFETVYISPYCVDLVACNRMLKTLKRIAKISENFPVRPQSFGQYATFIAKGLGVKRYAYVIGEKTSWHTTTEYGFRPVASLAEDIDSSLAAQKERLGFKQEVAS